MDKLKRHSSNLTQDNIARIRELFPGCITEVKGEDDRMKRVVDFDLLRQELSDDLVEGPQERYRLDWPGKREALLTAGTPIARALRPCREESVDFDTTQNLFIEGDNLDALKLLQETYLGKVRMIYIDPPYNTGKDFIYKDNFKRSSWQELSDSGQVDEDSNRLVANPDSNGRYHSNWLSMMYPRLRLARNLLADDGVIFISIDDHEAANLKKLCDEVFGAGHFVGEMIRKTKSTTNDKKTGFNLQHEFCLIYQKNSASLQGEKKDLTKYTNPDNDPAGAWISDNPSARTGHTRFPIENPYTGRVDYPPKGRCWRFSAASCERHIQSGKIKFKRTHSDKERGFIFKSYLSELKSKHNQLNSLFPAENRYMNQAATKEGNMLFGDSMMSYPKPIAFIEKLVKYATWNDDLILDFFAGSCTSAHAVMQCNAEDGGKRRFIMVQLPEPTPDDSAARQGGFATIADIGKERIRRAGKALTRNEVGASQPADYLIRKMV